MNARNFTKAQAVEIWERQDWLCADCGIQVGNYDEVHVPHHIRFKSQAGGNENDNGVGLCHSCHAARHGIEVVE
jgi:5-methylcytosine-specific restriction endonuclease McrA